MPEYDRRMNDAKIDLLETEIKELCSNSIVNHVANDHHPISNEEVDRILVERLENRKIVSRVVEMLEGKPVVDLQGNVIAHEDGVQQLTKKNYETLIEIEKRTNGGVTVLQKFKPEWSRSQKIAAWTGLGMFVTQFVAVMISVLV